MTALEIATEELTSIETNIAGLQKRLTFANYLGDNYTAGGKSHGFAGNLEWEKRLANLKIWRFYYRELIDHINGVGPLPVIPDGRYLSVG